MPSWTQFLVCHGGSRSHHRIPRQLLHATFYTYRLHAETAARTCQNMLLREGLPGRVTYRVKDARSLERKLRKRQENRGSPYPDRGAIERDISDLAGIRVALCFPRHKEAVKRCIRSLFAVQREKKVIVGESQGRRFLGYCADHYRASLRDEHIQFHEPLRGQQLRRIEIQVVSLLRHAWAEVEHDLVYKQAARTSPVSVKRWMDSAVLSSWASAFWIDYTAQIILSLWEPFSRPSSGLDAWPPSGLWDWLKGKGRSRRRCTRSCEISQGLWRWRDRGKHCFSCP